MFEREIMCYIVSKLNLNFEMLLTRRIWDPGVHDHRYRLERWGMLKRFDSNARHIFGAIVAPDSFRSLIIGRNGISGFSRADYT